MNGLALAMVLGSGMLHAIWNLLAKRSGSQMAFLWWAQLVAVVVFLPIALLLEWDVIPIGLIPSGYLLISMTLHGAYLVLLAFAYRAGDLSVVYPIVRGTGPVLVPLLGVLVLHDRLSLWNAAGIALIALGIWLIGRGRRSSGAVPGKVIGLALAVGLAITAYTFVDKLAISYGGIPPLTLNAASNVGNWLCLMPFALREGRWAAEGRENKRFWMLGGLFASGGYTLFLYALQLEPVSRLAPMREIGTVFGTLLGIFILKEAHGPDRLIASTLIVLGVIAMAL